MLSLSNSYAQGNIFGYLIRAFHEPGHVALALKNAFSTALTCRLLPVIVPRNLDIKESSTMLTNTLIWRTKFNADHLLEENFDENVLGRIGFLHKTDKYGRPVTYNLYGGDIDMEAVFGDVEK
jgi:hypothetical protein